MLSMRFLAHRLPVLLAVLSAGAPAAAALNSFSPLDRVGRWVIERKNTAEGAINCRAYIPSGGTWFNSNVRIGPDGTVVVPDGLRYSPDPAELSQVQDALRRCRADMIYVP